MKQLGQAVLLVLLAVAGAVAGVVGSYVHDVSVEVLGLGLPVGLLVGLGTTAAVCLLAGWLVGNRLAVLAPAAAWFVPVLVLSTRRPEGDLVIAARPAGYVFLLGGSVLIGLVIAMPYGHRRPPARPVP